MRPFHVGNILVSSFIERDGPWRAPTTMFPTADRETALSHLKNMAPEVYDAAQELLVITYQTLWKDARHNILIDTCVGDHKPLRGPALDYPKNLGLMVLRRMVCVLTILTMYSAHTCMWITVVGTLTYKRKMGPDFSECHIFLEKLSTRHGDCR